MVSLSSGLCQSKLGFIPPNKVFDGSNFYLNHDTVVKLSKALNLEFCCVLTDLHAGVDVVKNFLTTTQLSLDKKHFSVPFMEFIDLLTINYWRKLG